MELLNPFPALLDYRIFAPTLLRIVAAITILYLAYAQYKRADEITQLNLPVVGKNSWWYKVSVAFNVIVGGMLFFGSFTQIAALLAIAGQLKGLWLNHRHPSVIILGDSAIFLLIAILLSLLVTGAGLFAFDIPGL
jgi:hypothetical protein